MRWLDGITDSMDVSLGGLWDVGDGQGGLACCSPWGRKESDMTERLNNNNKVEKINDSLNYQRKAEIKSRYADY